MATPSPDREKLLNYLQGKLSDAESEQIAQLVADDPTVRNQLDELDRSGDTFIDMLRQEGESTPTEGYSECGNALDRAKHIFDKKNSLKIGLQENENDVGTLGEYELIERIGQGGMGVVFKAKHTKLGRTVAIKVIVENRASDDRAIARFEREIKAIGQLDHPSIVHAHDAREIDGRSILVMEYVDGMDLGRLNRRHGPIATSDACELIRQAALGLQAAHEHGLVHRDVKPSNLMLDRQGNIKILDLGLAREATNLKELRREISVSFDLTQTGQAMGTADYMAPEQADHPGMVDIRADIYSTGCTLFKLLTGRAPYHEEMTFDKLSAHAEQPLPPTPDLPEPLRAILDRMTAKNPDDRFDTPEEVAHALKPFCADHNLTALLTRAEAQTAPALTLPSPSSGGRFRRIITILLLMAFAGGLGLWGGIILTIKRDGKETTVKIPEGSKATVNENGDITLNLDKTSELNPDEEIAKKVFEALTTPYKWTDEEIKEELAEVQKSPYTVVTFKTRPKSIYDGLWKSDWAMDYHEILKCIIVELGPESATWQKHFNVTTPTTIFLKDGKEVFREKGRANSPKIVKKILSHLPPIKFYEAGGLFSSGEKTGLYLGVTSQPGQSKRCAGKTLQITWPNNCHPATLSNGYQNLNEQSVEWPISENTFKNQALSYQIEFLYRSPKGNAEFRANLLNKKGEVEWSIPIKRDLQIGSSPLINPPAITPKDTNANEKDLQQLYGTWKVISLTQKNGVTVDLKDNYMEVVIEKEQIKIFKGLDPTNQKPPFETFTYKIDATTTPKRITTSDNPKSKEKPRGIYNLKGDQLTICFGNGQFPADFSQSNTETMKLVKIGEPRESLRLQREKLAKIEKSPYAMVTFQHPDFGGTSGYYDTGANWTKLQSNSLLQFTNINYFRINLYPKPKLLMANFQATYPTTIFLENGKEVFRMNGDINVDEIAQKILPNIPPVKIYTVSLDSYDGLAPAGPSAYQSEKLNVFNLTIQSRPGQSKRCAGRTLQVIWPPCVEVDSLTDNYQNYKKQSIVWVIPKETFENQELLYQMQFHAVKPQGNTELRVNLLDDKGKIEWSMATKCDIQPPPAPLVTLPPPKKENENQNKKELQLLQGTWKVRSMTDDGRVLQKKEIANVRLTIKGSHLQWTGGPGSLKGNGPFKINKGLFTINATPTPKRISWPHGMEIYSIYKIEGDRLTLCWAERPKDGHPTKFVSEKNSPNDRLTVLQLVKPSDKKTPQYPVGSGADALVHANHLTGVWKLVERPNKDGCLIFTGKDEKTPEATVTFTDKKLYLRGKDIVNRQFSYEVSPDRKNINLVDGRKQVYRGVMSFQQNGKRLIFVCGKKERPAGSWEYFGTDFDRLVLEKTKAKPNTKAITFDKSLNKKWFLMSTKPMTEGILNSSLAGRFFIDTGENHSFYHLASVTFSTDGHLILDKTPYYPETKKEWPKRWAYNIDPSTTPKRIDIITDRVKAMQGIYKTEGDRLFIRFADEKRARPKDFKSPPTKDLVELEFACSAAPTPKLATLLITRGGTVCDGHFISPPDTPNTCVTPIAKRLNQHPGIKVVIDEPYLTSSLIALRHRLLDVGVKSVQIKSSDQPNLFPESIHYCRLKDLPKIYDIPAKKLETLNKQLPKAFSFNKNFLHKGMTGQAGGDYALRYGPMSKQTLWAQNVEVLPHVIRVTLHPKVVKQLQIIKLKPDEQTAIFTQSSLIIATPTFKTLKKGTFDIDCQLNEEERKILIHILKSAKEPQGMGGGTGGGMF